MNFDIRRKRIDISQFQQKEIFSQSLKDFNKKYYPIPIEHPKDGISQKFLYNVEESSLSNLICGICFNLVWDAVECQDCGNCFCRHCSNQSKNLSNDRCPMCKSSPFNIRPSKTLKRFLSKIRIKCIHNNCEERPEYFDFINHIDNCKFRLFQCGNQGCNFQDIELIMKMHINECQYRIIKCKYCNKDIKAYNFQNHEKTECSQNIKCDKCHKTMTRGFYWSRHYNENDENIECLKGQIEYFKNKYEKSNEKIEELKEAHQKEILSLKNNIKKLEKEKNEYIKKDEISNKKLNDWENAIKDIYDKFIIKKNEKDVQKSEQYHTLDNEHKYNTNTYDFRNNNNYYNKIQMTPNHNSRKNINYYKNLK